MLAYTVRSVRPAVAAMSRIRAPVLLAISAWTCPCPVSIVQLPPGADQMLTIRGRTPGEPGTTKPTPGLIAGDRLQRGWRQPLVAGMRLRVPLPRAPRRAVWSAAVCAVPGPVSFPGRPSGDAERDDGIDRPPAWPDGDDRQGEEDRGGLGGAHQVLGTLPGGGARA